MTTISTTLRPSTVATRALVGGAASWYLDAVDGREVEIAAALSELARAGHAAKLPRPIAGT